MNARIRELAKQATTITYEDDGWRLYGTEVETFNKQKFAELIVRECMNLAEAEQKRYASISHRNMSECAVALGNFSLLVKDHFGDEE